MKAKMIADVFRSTMFLSLYLLLVVPYSVQAGGEEEDDQAEQQDEEVVEPADEAAEMPWGLDMEGATVPFAPELQAPPSEVQEGPFGFGLMPAEEGPSAPADVDAAEPPAAEDKEAQEEETAVEPVAESLEKEAPRRRRRRRRKPRPG